MADTKVSALTADTAPTVDDLLYTVHDPGGTPASRKVVIADLLALGKIGARVFRGSNQSLSTGALTAIAMDNERYDHGAFHDNATNNTRLTAPISGIYVIVGHCSFATNATGLRTLAIRLNGTTEIAHVRQQAISGVTTRNVVTTIYAMASTDYVELMAQQNSGGNLDVESVTNWSPEFAIHLLART